MKVLYIGSGSEGIGSLLDSSEKRVSTEVFATTQIDAAIQELIRTRYEMVVFDPRVSEPGIKLIEGTAGLNGHRPPVIIQRGSPPESGENDRSFVDEVIGEDEPLPTDYDFGNRLDQTGEGAVITHPLLASIGRSVDNRILAHLGQGGDYLWTNDKLASLHNGEHSTLIGSTITDQPPPAVDNEQLSTVLESAIQSGELQWIGTDGAVEFEIYCLYPIDDESVLLFSYSAGTNLPFGKRFLDEITDFFFIVDFEGNLYYWNKRVNEVTGYSDAELLDINALDLFAPDERDIVETRLQEVAAYGDRTVEASLLTRDEETIPYRFSGSSVESRDGIPRFVCGIGRDISHRIEMQKEIEDAMERLEESNAELERFASVASHDLREPLRAIRSYLQLLDRRYSDELDDEAHEFIAFAVDGAERMQAMIEDLLEYSRISTSVTTAPVDCNDVLAEVCENLSVSIEESESDIVSEELPVVAGDQTLLVQLLQNLIDNAIQHAQIDSPRIHLSAERIDGWWEFAIEDNGQGIPPEKMDDIFDMFSTRDHADGLGIGLPTCRKIVETHGGEMTVESRKSEGTTFYFTLPGANRQEGIG